MSNDFEEKIKNYCLRSYKKKTFNAHIFLTKKWNFGDQKQAHCDEYVVRTIKKRLEKNTPTISRFFNDSISVRQ